MLDMVLTDLRFTTFSNLIGTADVASSHGHLESLYKSITNNPPVSIQRTQQPTGYVTAATAPLNGNELTLTAQPGRIDLNITPIQSQNPPSTPPALSGGEELIDAISSFGAVASSSIPEVNRIALGTGSVSFFTDRDEANAAFSALTNFDLHSGGLIEPYLRFNKRSKPEGNLLINEIISYEVGQLQLLQVTNGSFNVKNMEVLRITGDFNNVLSDSALSGAELEGLITRIKQDALRVFRNPALSDRK